MEAFDTPDIQEVPLQTPFFRSKVERFLADNGLRMEALNLYYTVQDADGNIVAGAGLAGDVIKCVAVAEEARSAGYTLPLLSRIVSEASSRGISHLKVFTKPEYENVFGSIGFHTIARAPKAILMENGRGLEDYCAYLSTLKGNGSSTGVIVMNANPFTLGHEYLVRQASAAADRVIIIPVKQDVSLFPYSERLEMMREGCGQAAVVAEGSEYQISAATFPTYFLKDLSDAAETQMRLDIDLFGRHIAPALGAGVRFVGSEQSDPLTARYNALMLKLLPSYGVRVQVIPRMKSSNGRFVRASRVRELLSQGRYKAAASLTPAPVHPYLKAFLAERALKMELDTPLKPGLVGPDSSGAHKDMDYALMSRSIAAIRPFFPRMAQASSAGELRETGIEAEKAMMDATGGVNTHRGAIFSLGIALRASAAVPDGSRQITEDKVLMYSACKKIAAGILRKAREVSNLSEAAPSHGAEAVRKYGVKGARDMAADGYKDLFAHWLPYYSSIKKQPYALQRMLVCLIATLDDTCIIHRAGYERSEELRDEAADIFGEIAHSTDYDKTKLLLEGLCRRYASEGISPGGSADMLALTIFIDSLLTNN
ncbi:MAG: [citrate (pro-3S)-lyase] ligase [Bacteroidales bacterium]|nr:[citrate (pro-3S)-lyase] ligase [Bacteroidales bacterium]